MSAEHLPSYLNDHLAGAVGALELVDHLISAHAHTPLAQFLTQLRGEIEEDKITLEGLLHQLGATESRTRQAAAWLAEKFAEIKLRLTAQVDSDFARLEAFEALSLGIEGKRSLWLALAEIADAVPAVRALDLPRLERRAREQRAGVEARRLDAARAAFATENVSGRDKSGPR
jgi:hypothetical protein